MTSRPVLSETYVHTWDAAYDRATGLTVIDDSIHGHRPQPVQLRHDDSNYLEPQHQRPARPSRAPTPTRARPTNTPPSPSRAPRSSSTSSRTPTTASPPCRSTAAPRPWSTSTTRPAAATSWCWAASNLLPRGQPHPQGPGDRHQEPQGGRLQHVAIDAAVVSDAPPASPSPTAPSAPARPRTAAASPRSTTAAPPAPSPSAAAAPRPQTCGGSGEDNVCGNGDVVDDKVAGTAHQPVQLLRRGWSSCYRCGNGSLYNSSQSPEQDHRAPTPTFAFTGVKIKLYGIKGPTHGIGAVSIDGGAETTVDFYNATVLGDQLVCTSPTLPYGQHTLKVRVTGTKNASATDYLRGARPGRGRRQRHLHDGERRRLLLASGQELRLRSPAPTTAAAAAPSPPAAPARSGETCGDGVCAADRQQPVHQPLLRQRHHRLDHLLLPGRRARSRRDATGQDGSGSAQDRHPLELHRTSTGTRRSTRRDRQRRRLHPDRLLPEGRGRPARRSPPSASEEGGAYTVYAQQMHQQLRLDPCTVTCTPPRGKLVKFGIRGLGATSTCASTT